jgi:hypothetical protein
MAGKANMAVARPIAARAGKLAGVAAAALLSACSTLAPQSSAPEP